MFAVSPKKPSMLFVSATLQNEPMKATLRYLAGMAGPSGFGSNSTAEQVTEDSSCFLSSPLTALITGKSQKELPEDTCVKITMKI